MFKESYKPDSLVFKNVKSSQISGVFLDSAKNHLYVKFKNTTVYVYENVDIKEYFAFMNSKSIGAYFHQNIKTKNYKKLL